VINTREIASDIAKIFHKDPNTLMLCTIPGELIQLPLDFKDDFNMSIDLSLWVFSDSTSNISVAFNLTSDYNITLLSLEHKS